MFNPFGMGPYGPTPEQQMLMSSNSQIAQMNLLGMGEPALIEPNTAPNPMGFFSALGATMMGPQAVQELSQRATRTAQSNAFLKQRAEEANQRAKNRAQDRLEEIKMRVAEIRARRDQTLQEWGLRREEGRLSRSASRGRDEAQREFDEKQKRLDREHDIKMRGMMDKSTEKSDAAFDETYLPMVIDKLDDMRNGVLVDPKQIINGVPVPGAEKRALTLDELMQASDQIKMFLAAVNISDDKKERLLGELAKAYEDGLTEAKKAEMLGRPIPQPAGAEQEAQERREESVRGLRERVSRLEGGKFTNPAIGQDVQFLEDVLGSFVDGESGADLFGQRNIDVFKQGMR